MKLLRQGAEAKVFVGTYLGEKCVMKVREEKPYREKSLDEKIIRERMRTECGLISRAKSAGVRTPLIRKIDAVNRTIIEEFISGNTLKKELASAKKDKAAKLCTALGTEIAKLHSGGIVHGDLTTGNVIVSGGKLVFFDFGLGEVSRKTEDRAVDLLALKKTFAATHFRILPFWKKVEQAYARGIGSGGAEVLLQIKEVEARARYI